MPRTFPVASITAPLRRSLVHALGTYGEQYRSPRFSLGGRAVLLRKFASNSNPAFLRRLDVDSEVCYLLQRILQQQSFFANRNTKPFLT